MRPFVAVTLLAVIGTCYAARLENTYLPPGSAGSAGGAGLIQAPNRGGGGPIKLTGPAGQGGFGGGPGTGGFGGGPGTGGFGGGPGSSGFGGGSGAGSNSYVPPTGGSGPRGNIGAGPGNFRPSGPSGGGPSGGGPRGGAGAGQDIPIVSYSNENSGDGNYQFSYETGNGISAQETGQLQGQSEAVSGSYSYTGPDGVQYSVSYTADETGFHPQGAHLPTPPPIPPEIQRGVELALAAEARGENQDGSAGSDGAGYPQGGPGGFAPAGGRGGPGVRGGSAAYQGPNSYQTSSGGGYRY